MRVKQIKNILFFLIIAVPISLSLSCDNENINEPEPDPGSRLFTGIDTALNIQTIEDGKLIIYKIDKYSTTVVKIPHISSYLYIQNPNKAIKEIAADSNYLLVINGSFFDVFYEDSINFSDLNYAHAGYLKIDNIHYTNIKDDRQLSRHFAYNSKENTVGDFCVNHVDSTSDYDLVFQTGPQIIRDNQIDSTSIDVSINGNSLHQRTAFASTNGIDFYVIVTLDFVTLKDLGKMLISSGIFKKNLNIINFDGGSSTSLFIKNHPELNWNTDRRLPLLLCVK